MSNGLSDLSALKSNVRRHLVDDASAPGDTIHTRGSNRGSLLRVPSAGPALIVKTWLLRGLKDFVKTTLGISNGMREWRMHNLIRVAGVPVPEPVAFFRLQVRRRRSYQVMVVEDLGTTKKALQHLKDLIAAGAESDVLSFEDALIDQTVTLVRAGFVDIDHQLNNFVLDEAGHLFRLDFECARRFPLKFMPQRMYASMLARFITGHIHAVQPAVGRSVAFADRLYAALSVSRVVRRMVSSIVNEHMEHQRVHGGVSTRIVLPS